MPQQERRVELTSKSAVPVLEERRRMYREEVGFLETSAPPEKPRNPPDRRGVKRRSPQSQPVVFLGRAAYEHQPQVDIAFGCRSSQRTEKIEDEAPAASEEAVRKEQVQPEESVSSAAELFHALMTELSNEGMDTEESLQETVEVLFERAVETPHSAAHLAELCQDLSKVSSASMTGS